MSAEKRTFCFASILHASFLTCLFVWTRSRSKKFFFIVQILKNASWLWQNCKRCSELVRFSVFRCHSPSLTFWSSLCFHFGIQSLTRLDTRKFDSSTLLFDAIDAEKVASFMLENQMPVMDSILKIISAEALLYTELVRFSLLFFVLRTYSLHGKRESALFFAFSNFFVFSLSIVLFQQFSHLNSIFCERY